MCIKALVSSVQPLRVFLLFCFIGLQGMDQEITLQFMSPTRRYRSDFPGLAFRAFFSWSHCSSGPGSCLFRSTAGNFYLEREFPLFLGDTFVSLLKSHQPVRSSLSKGFSNFMKTSTSSLFKITSSRSASRSPVPPWEKISFPTVWRRREMGLLLFSPISQNSPLLLHGSSICFFTSFEKLLLFSEDIRKTAARCFFSFFKHFFSCFTSFCAIRSTSCEPLPPS